MISAQYCNVRTSELNKPKVHGKTGSEAHLKELKPRLTHM